MWTSFVPKVLEKKKNLKTTSTFTCRISDGLFFFDVDADIGLDRVIGVLDVIRVNKAVVEYADFIANTKVMLVQVAVEEHAREQYGRPESMKLRYGTTRNVSPQ